jgi:hypothetical protein
MAPPSHAESFLLDSSRIESKHFCGPWGVSVTAELFHDFSLVFSLTATATGTCANNFVANSGGLLKSRAGRGACGRQSRQRAWTIRTAMTMKGAMI